MGPHLTGTPPNVPLAGLYCDFFYHYYQSKRGGMNRPVKLPV